MGNDRMLMSLRTTVRLHFKIFYIMTIMLRMERKRYVLKLFIIIKMFFLLSLHIYLCAVQGFDGGYILRSIPSNFKGIKFLGLFFYSSQKILYMQKHFVRCKWPTL